MPSKKRRSTRCRVGRVSLFLHHNAWWMYYREGGKVVRRKVGQSRTEAEQVAAQVNAQLTSGAPTLLSFTPINLPELRRQFLDYHEHVLKSAMATVCRYRAATQHLETFSLGLHKAPQAHEIRPHDFISYLRQVEIAPNGHPNTTRRRLRDKGIQFIAETCRAMFSFAGKRRYLPPYAGNPFAEIPLGQLKIEDAKPIFVFDADSELAFFRGASPWAFCIHFFLSKTGLRVGELVHLLIENVDLESGWLHVVNKPGLGWRIKTGSERVVPLLSEVVAILRRVIGDRKAGPVFLGQRLAHGALPPLVGDCSALERICLVRQQAATCPPSRSEILRIARSVWRDAGAVSAEALRTSFIHIAQAIGFPQATCPKSWRHTFATLLQDANVDPLIRQITLGHKPTITNGLGMTATYTHTRPETQRQQIELALRRWPQSLELARHFVKEDKPC